MAKRIGMEIALAAAEAAALCNLDVVAAYPITPNTHIPEHLSDIVADGRIDAEFICVESEHSALSACCGASAAGARVFTATSSQGLLFMGEVMPIVSAMRLPVVMAIGNRALSGPINIWNDHSDIMSQRDMGWISLLACRSKTWSMVSTERHPHPLIQRYRKRCSKDINGVRHRLQEGLQILLSQSLPKTEKQLGIWPKLRKTSLPMPCILPLVSNF